MPSLRHKRGTRAQIDAAATASGLKAGEVYLITDENRLTVGTAVNAHQPAAKQGEGGGGGSAAFTTVEIDFGYPMRRSGRFTIAVSGQTVGKPVKIWIARGPYTGKGTQPGEESMYAAQLTGEVTAANLISGSFAANCRMGGNIKLNYQIGG